MVEKKKRKKGRRLIKVLILTWRDYKSFKCVLSNDWHFSYSFLFCRKARSGTAETVANASAVAVISYLRLKNVLTSQTVIWWVASLKLSRIPIRIHYTLVALLSLTHAHARGVIP